MSPIFPLEFEVFVLFFFKLFKGIDHKCVAFTVVLHALVLEKSQTKLEELELN